LTFAGTPTWTPSGVGRGELVVTIGEADAQVVLAAAALPTAAPAAVPRHLRIELTAEAETVEDEAGLPASCTVVASAGGQGVECVVDPPSGSDTVELRVPLTVWAPDQSATLTLLRGTATEATAVVPLDRYEEGLALVPSSWMRSSRPGHDFPFGQLTVGAEHLGTRTLPGVSLEITLAGDAGFIPGAPGATLLPEGCTTPDWPPPGDDGELHLAEGQVRPPALVGGLPTTVVCDLGDVAPGAALELLDLIALVRPWYRDGDGVDEAPTATVTLRLQDPVTDRAVPPEVHDIASEPSIPLDLPEG
jgi:hypothetical protein